MDQKSETKENNEKNESETQLVTKNDPETVDKCLDIFIALLQSPSVKEFNSHLRNVNDMLIFEMRMFQEPLLQAKFIKCSGLLCFLDRTSAAKYVQLFCVPFKSYKFNEHCHPEILLSSIRTVTDLILMFSPNILIQESNSEEELLFNEQIEFSELIDIFTTMLDCDETEIRECSGTSLMLFLANDCYQSPILVSRLILKWYSPHTAKDEKLSQTLGVFLEDFANYTFAASQLEGAVIPTLRTLYLAPQTSPLADIPKDSLIKFLAKINNSTSAQKNLSLLLCNELMIDDQDICNIGFVKCLLELDIPNDNQDDIDELYSLCEDIKCDTANRNVLKYISKFMNNLRES